MRVQVNYVISARSENAFEYVHIFGSSRGNQYCIHSFNEFLLPRQETAVGSPSVEIQ